MTLATELELKALITNYLANNPIREVVYIKIVDNTVRIGNSIKEVEILKIYSTQESPDDMEEE